MQDYQNQFARIVDKEGAAGVMKKLEEKKAEMARGDAGKSGVGKTAAAK